MTPRVVTGAGVASALGVGRAAFVDGLRAGVLPPEEGRTIEAFDASRYAIDGVPPRCAEVPGFDPVRYLGDKGLRSLDRLTKLMLVGARLALEDAGLKQGGVWASLPAGAGAAPWTERVGVVISNAYGSLEAIHELHSVAVLEDPRYINPSRFPLTVSNSAAGYISIWEDLHALNVTVSDGNCGGLDAVGCADLLLAAGRADVLLVGGAEALSEPLLVGLRRLGAAGPTGLRIGEGCALVVLESPENAARRGATALAEIVGYAAAFAPPPHAGQLVHASADALEQAIRQALDDAGVQPQEIDLVVSAASGIAAFDDAEQRAVERVLGEGACVVAPKRALGETFGAGGGMAMLAAVAYLQGGARSHVVRGELRGPAKELRTALITAPGYYGNAAALVMRAPSR